jgi:uncharacterized protein YbaR (Trm112 family)
LQIDRRCGRLGEFQKLDNYGQLNQDLAPEDYAVKAELLNLLVCPENHSRLHAASAEMLAKLNAAITAGRLKNRAGRTLEQRIDAALVRADDTIAYSVVDDIPRMLLDEGIPLDQLDG